MGIARISIRAATATIVAVASISAFILFPPTSSGYTFATGTYTFKIDSHAIYNGVVQIASTWNLKKLVPGADKFFNLDDVKPGDNGEATISFHVNKDSWICMNFSNLQDKENGENEPESLADLVGPATDGELAEGLEFFAWRDDGDNIFEIGEKPIFGTTTQSAAIVLKNKTYTIADSLNGPFIPANTPKYIGITWCAGNLTVNVPTATITCDGTALGNEAQTDSMSVDISFSAVPKSDKPTFTCDGGGGHKPPGEEIGLYVKCELLASQGWPFPSFATECPDGFKIEEQKTVTRNDIIDTRSTVTRTTRTR